MNAAYRFEPLPWDMSSISREDDAAQAEHEAGLERMEQRAAEYLCGEYDTWSDAAFAAIPFPSLEV